MPSPSFSLYPALGEGTARGCGQSLQPRWVPELPPAAGKEGAAEIPVLPSMLGKKLKMSPFGFKDLEKVFLTKTVSHIQK